MVELPVEGFASQSILRAFPKTAPTILLEHDLDNLIIQVLEAEKLWTVVYNEQPINLRKLVWAVEGESKKYMRNSFTNQANCQNLADRLNRWFKTTEFTVKRVL